MIYFIYGKFVIVRLKGNGRKLFVKSIACV